MPDFNKGDFTQQGVNGHVNATVRLNEKRLVNIDMTSNEEAEGCTITGTVTDLLNNQVYGVGAGVSGNIEITENGENINVAPYATATVNVSGGGGSVPMCAVTVTNNAETDYTDIPPHIDENYYYYVSLVIPAGESAIVHCLYQDLTEYMGNYIVMQAAVTSNMGPLMIRESDISNMVNLTLLAGPSEGTYRLVPTDPTQPSSCTLPASVVFPK